MLINLLYAEPLCNCHSDDRDIKLHNDDKFLGKDQYKSA